MTTVSLKLPGPLAAALKAAARRRGSTKSAIMRDALERFLREAPAEKGSFVDLAGDLIGSVEGPSDLATNKKYMEGFGQ